MGIAQITLLAWIPIAMIIGALFRPRRAVIISYALGWLFLPMITIDLGPIPYDKLMATSLGVLLAAIFLDPGTILRFRPKWVDIPMYAFCAAPVLAAFYNHLGAGMAVRGLLQNVFQFAIPWFLGRIYINDLAAAREMAIAVFIGGLVYAPLCLVEIRLSPILHEKIYGVVQHDDFQQSIRFGGYRPMVFLQHGLAVGNLMAASCLTGFWLWWTGSLTRLWGLRVAPLLLFVCFVTVLCKSSGAVILLIVGMVVILTPKRMRSYALVTVLMLTPPVYCYLRASGAWTGDAAVQYAAKYLNGERAQSIEFRFVNENAISENALHHPLLGCGPGPDFLVVNKFGLPSIPDGLWIIALGTTGIMGLSALLLTFIVPCVGFIRHLPRQYWEDPRFAGATGLVIFTSLFAIDCLMNAMINPNWTLAGGGLATLTYTLMREARLARRNRRYSQAIGQTHAPSIVQANVPAHASAQVDPRRDPARLQSFEASIRQQEFA